ncbi:fumarylacetoacetate hydrolase family protein [uncultured Acinetobacter sp.]|uniref:fumarylacetoacetate hydrolase family protein n=1 Tax=uncultured Acinetobacter sp. TaxID=165433 RepID=UPI002587CC5D|nr:fumarylacetoacetate hydrolase family protein [uncultured Acinetobacter sp.]
MKFASLPNASRDGEVVFVSRDLSRAQKISSYSSLIQLLENWDQIEYQLKAAYEIFNDDISAGFPFDPTHALAPLPRCYQFVDGSAFLNHGKIMKAAYKVENEEPEGVPILIQRQSDDFRSAYADYEYIKVEDQCDFEGEFAVVVSDTAMGSSKTEISKNIKLIMLMNDVSMRNLLKREIKMGFGFIQAKTATIFAPVAVTPDELGNAWVNDKVHLDLNVYRNSELFGHPNGSEMNYSFSELITHLSYNRNLKAGTIIGSGTVSNIDAKTAGSACLAEGIALEVLETGQAKSTFIQSGEVIEMKVYDVDNKPVFGKIKTRFLAKN